MIGRKIREREREREPNDERVKGMYVCRVRERKWKDVEEGMEVGCT